MRMVRLDPDGTRPVLSLASRYSDFHSYTHTPQVVLLATDPCVVGIAQGVRGIMSCLHRIRLYPLCGDLSEVTFCSGLGPSWIYPTYMF